LGARGTETGQKLWYSLKEIAASDYWQSYENFIPKEIHVQSKKETFTVEGYNSILQHFLVHLRRKTKCYSKCRYMLRYSIFLLMMKRNGDLAILSEQSQILQVLSGIPVK